MKSMTQIFTGLIAISLLAQSASAGCLTQVPKSEYELDRQIKIAKMREKSAIENEKNYVELAHDAAKTRAWATAVGGAALVIPAGVGAFTSMFILGMGSALIGIPALGASLGVLAVDGHVNFQAIRSAVKSDAEARQISKELRDQMITGKYSCSYDEVRAKIAQERQRIMDHELSGSTLRTIQDHVTLGSLSAKATAKLAMLSSLEREVAASEVKELKSISYSSTAPVAQKSTSISKSVRGKG